MPSDNYFLFFKYSVIIESKKENSSFLSVPVKSLHGLQAGLVINFAVGNL